jgi:hypothetical protein
MKAEWIVGIGLVLGTAAACVPDPQSRTSGGSGGATSTGPGSTTSTGGGSSSTTSTGGGSGGAMSMDGGNLSTTASSTSSSSSASTGGADPCHRTGVVASCYRPGQMGSGTVCVEVFDQAQAAALMQGCGANPGEQYSTGPCDRTGSIGFCAEPDLGGPGEDYYYYDANHSSIAQGECSGPLMGTWCPLP